MARLPEGVLMSRATTGLAVSCMRVLRARTSGTVVGASVAILCGAGNNGGDALYAGASLRRRGARVTAVLLAPEHAHPGGLGALRRAGGRVVPASEAAPAVQALSRADLVLDGVVGIGGSGPLRPAAAELAAAAEQGPAAVVAVDLPSGVQPDTGEVPGPAVCADVTVTFGCLKPGLVVAAGRRCSGAISVVDIGLLPDLRAAAEPALVRYSDADVARLLPRPTSTDSKYSRGVLGIVAGSRRFPGAAVLTAGGALATGVGMVRMVSVRPVVSEVRTRYPSVVGTEVSDAPGSEGTVSDPEAVLAAGRVQAWVIGPGLGVTAGAAAVVEGILAQDVPVLVDADALTLLAGSPAVLRSRTAPTLLTPHDGEFARLFPAVPEENLARDRVGAVRAAASLAEATLLLKGDATLVADPAGDGRAAGPVVVNGTGTPWLASAGSGDVLSGVAGALLATGLSPREAGAVASHVHGLAGQRRGGGSSSDLASEVEATVAELRREVA